MTTPQDLDRANAFYDSDLHHLALLADEPKGSTPWPGIIAFFVALLLAFFFLVFITGCSAPSAQDEAEDVAASVQDSETAAMQAHLDATCGHLAGRAGMHCSLAELQRLQPDRWTPEDKERAAAAVQIATE